MTKRKENLNELAQKTTDKIIAILESGSMDNNAWSKGWIEHKGCYNVVTNTIYKGFNQFTLSMLDYETPQYSTFKGWQSIDCKIKKGEKGHKIQVYSINKKEDKKTGEEKTILYSNVAYVFNAQQVEGEIPPFENFKNPESTNNEIEKFISNCDINTIHKFSNKAYYTPLYDNVTMPKFEQFKGSVEYYATLFHEYAHATGHKDRLNRNMKGDFGSSDYAFEELIAELSSVFTMQHLGYYDTAIRQDHLKYLSSWLKALKDDNTFIIKAMSKAVKASEYLINKQIKKENQKIA
tara:strand:+ start:139 stop:1017 length:879 start_codon:yes stop_codon:yes gene_type:complete